MATTENEYYLRSTLLIMKGGVYATRKILLREVQRNGGDINILLLGQRRKLEHEFHKKQIEKLFPFGGETNIDVWDIAMLTGVLLIVFKSTLNDEDRSAIRTIKSNRNEVSAHNPTASLSIDTYEYCRDELKAAIEQLCSTFDTAIKNECKDIIRDCLSGTLEIKSCLDSMKMFGDTDDLFRALINKFDSTGKQLSEQITSAKRDICQAVHDEKEKQTSEIRNMVIEAVRKAYHEGRIMKTVKVVDSEITVGGSTERWIDLIEKIIVDVTNKAVKNIGGSTEFVEIEKAVLELLDEINSHDDVEVNGAINGSIVLRISCSTYKGLLDVLLFTMSPAMQQKLDKIAVSLQSYFGLSQRLRLSIQVSDDQLKSLWNELNYVTKQKTFRLPITCSSFGGLEHVWNLFEGGGCKSLKKLASTLSAHFDTPVTFTSAVNVQQYVHAVEEEGLIRQGSKANHQNIVDAFEKIVCMLHPMSVLWDLYKSDLLPHLIYNDFERESGKNENISEEFVRMFLYLLHHRFRSVQKRRTWKHFLQRLGELYLLSCRIPNAVKKIDSKTYKYFSHNIDLYLDVMEKLDSRYLFYKIISQPVITMKDKDKQFARFSLVLDLCWSKEEKHSLLQQMSGLLNETRNPLVSEITLLTRLAVNQYERCMLSLSCSFMHGALHKSCFVNPCYELIRMHSAHVFLSLLQYERFPTAECRNELLWSARTGLEMCKYTDEHPRMEYLLKLRMAFCLLGLANGGYIIQSHSDKRNIVIDQASITEAECLLQNIAQLESFNFNTERTHMYYFALVRLLILRSDYRLARFYIQGIMTELESSHSETEQTLTVAKSYLEDIDDVLAFDDKTLEHMEQPSANSATKTEESNCEQLEIKEPAVDFSDPEIVLSELRHMFDCFFNKRSEEDPKRKKPKKKRKKTKYKVKALSKYTDEPSLE